MIAGLGDLVTFACALALLFSPLASADYSLIVGNIMIANQVRKSACYQEPMCMIRSECADHIFDVLSRCSAARGHHPSCGLPCIKLVFISIALRLRCLQ